MELHARLIHAEAGLRVVEVRASRAGVRLGSALAEAATVQEAEDLAMERLLRRLGAEDLSAAAGRGLVTEQALGPVAPSAAATQPSLLEALDSRPHSRPAMPRTAAGQALPAPLRERPSGPGSPASETGDASSAVPASQPIRTGTTDRQQGSAATQQAQAPVPSPLSDEGAAGLPSDPQEEPPADPEDWSQELAAVDLQLRRLGWDRDQEGLYLQRAFGHHSRSRLTRYNDLRAYLMALEGLERGSDPAVAAVPLRRSELLVQGDSMLEQLGWSADQGRAFLERELSRSSRQQLSDVQLLQFNMLLEGELLARDGTLAVADQEGSQR